MDMREQGTRRVAAVTLGIAAAGVVGAIAVGGAAYAHTQNSGPSATTGTTSNDDDSTSTYPNLTGGNTNSNSGHATSGGS